MGRLNAQEPHIEQYGLEHGLPSLETYQVRLDSKGYLWIATDRGVCRFNGSEFITYDQKDGLKDITVFNMKEDEKGRMWVATFAHTLYYFEEGRFHAYQGNNQLKEKIESIIDDMVISEDTIWISVNLRGIYELTIDDSNELNVEKKTNAYLGTLQVKAKKKLTYFGFYERKSPLLLLFQEISEKDTLSYPIQIRKKEKYRSKISFLPLKNGDKALAVYNAFFILKENGEVILLPVQFPAANASILEEKDVLWVGSLQDGVRLFDINNGYQQIAHYLKGYSISYIEKDLQNGIWLTTLERGVMHIPSPDILNIELNKKGVERMLCFNHCQDAIYVGSDKGHIYLIKMEKEGEWFFEKLEKNIYEGEVTSLACFKNELIIRDEEELYRLSSESPHSVPFSGKRKNGSLVVYKNDLFSFGNRITRFDSLFKNDSSIKCNTLFRKGDVDDYGTLWLGAISGSSIFKNDSIISLKSFGKAFTNRVTDIYAKEEVFIATHGSGVIRINPKNRNIDFIDTQDKLPNNNPSAVYQDRNKNLWIATSKGICIFTLTKDNEYTFKKIYTSHDGILSGEIKDIMEYKDKICVLTQYGLSILPNIVEEGENFEPFTNLTSVHLLNQDSNLLKSEAVFTHNQNDLVFEFEGLSFKNAFDIRYAYRLIGIDSSYRITTDNYAQYASL